MQVKFNFDKKEITVQEDVNFGDLIDKLSKMFPDGEWKQFKLITNNVTYVTNPVTPVVIRPYWEPVYPWYQQWTDGGTSIGTGYRYTFDGDLDVAYTSIDNLTGEHTLNI